MDRHILFIGIQCLHSSINFAGVWKTLSRQATPLNCCTVALIQIWLRWNVDTHLNALKVETVHFFINIQNNHLFQRIIMIIGLSGLSAYRGFQSSKYFSCADFELDFWKKWIGMSHSTLYKLRNRFQWGIHSIPSIHWNDYSNIIIPH